MSNVARYSVGRSSRGGRTASSRRSHHHYQENEDDAEMPVHSNVGPYVKGSTGAGNNANVAVSRNSSRNSRSNNNKKSSSPASPRRSSNSNRNSKGRSSGRGRGGRVVKKKRPVDSYSDSDEDDSENSSDESYNSEEDTDYSGSDDDDDDESASDEDDESESDEELDSEEEEENSLIESASEYEEIDSPRQSSHNRKGGKSGRGSSNRSVSTIAHQFNHTRHNDDNMTQASNTQSIAARSLARAVNMTKHKGGSRLSLQAGLALKRRKADSPRLKAKLEHELLVDVNYNDGATELYKHIENHRWREAAERCRNFPIECKMWVFRTDKRNKKTLWRMLPIHTAILYRAPVYVIMDLMEAYPKGPSEVDDRNMLPIHMGCRVICKEDVLRVLLKHAPETVACKDSKGRTPKDFLTEEKDDKGSSGGGKGKKGKGGHSQSKVLKKVNQRNRRNLLKVLREYEIIYNRMTSAHSVAGSRFSDSRSHGGMGADDASAYNDDHTIASRFSQHSRAHSRSGRAVNRQSYQKEDSNNTLSGHSRGMASSNRSLGSQRSRSNSRSQSRSRPQSRGSSSGNARSSNSPRNAGGVGRLPPSPHDRPSTGNRLPRGHNVPPSPTQSRSISRGPSRRNADYDDDDDNQSVRSNRSQRVQRKPRAPIDTSDDDNQSVRSSRSRTSRVSRAPRGISVGPSSGPSANLPRTPRGPRGASVSASSPRSVSTPRGRDVDKSGSEGDIPDDVSRMTGRDSQYSHAGRGWEDDEDDGQSRISRVSRSVQRVTRKPRSGGSQIISNHEHEEQEAPNPLGISEIRISSLDEPTDVEDMMLEVDADEAAAVADDADTSVLSKDSSDAGSGNGEGDYAKSDPLYGLWKDIENIYPIPVEEFNPKLIAAQEQKRDHLRLKKEEAIHKIKYYDPPKELQKLLAVIENGGADESDLPGPQNNGSRAPTGRSGAARRVNACGALRALSKNAKNRLRLGRTKGVISSLLLALMDEDATSEERIRCSNTLMFLCVPRQNTEAICAANPDMLSILRDALGDSQPRVRYNICFCIFLLSKIEDNRLAIANDRSMMDALVTVADIAKTKTDDDDDDADDNDDDGDNLDNDEVSVDGSLNQRFANLGSPSGIRMQGAPETDEETDRGCRLSAMKVFLGVSKLREGAFAIVRNHDLMTLLVRISGTMTGEENTFCMAIFTNLSRNVENMERLHQVPRLLVTVKRGMESKNEECQKCACLTVQNLSTNVRFRRKIGTVQKIGLKKTNTAHQLLSGLAKHALDGGAPEKQMAAINAIRNLSIEPANMPVLLGTPGVTAALMLKLDGSSKSSSFVSANSSGTENIKNANALPVQSNDEKGESKDNQEEKMKYIASDSLAAMAHWLDAVTDTTMERNEIDVNGQSLVSMKVNTWNQWE